MKLKLLVLIIVGLVTNSFAFSQNCQQTELSKEFLFETEIKRFKSDEDSRDSCIVKINIKRISTSQIVQSIKFTSSFFSNDFDDCKSVRSYATGKNKNLDAMDNDYGDLVVADFNFDNREDFAVKSDSGGNGGPSYNYYIQDSNGNFKLDEFLSSEMIYFPSYINKNKKTLITIVHANAYQMGKTTFKLNAKKNKWEKVSHRFLTIK